VALPAFSCYDIATAAIGAGVRVTFYDLDPETLAPEPESLERALRAGARVVVIAPLYGIPVDWQSLEVIASRHGALLIEDAAQGHGASWNGRRLGSMGRLAVLSFARGKGWTGGRGGALLRNHSEYSEHPVAAESGLIDETANTIGLVAQWVLGRPEVYGVPRSIPALGLGETLYREPSTLTTIDRSAAMALIETEREAEAEAKVRRENASELLGTVAQNPRLKSISIVSGATAGYLRLPVRAPKGMRSFERPSAAITQGIAPSYPSVLAELPQLAGQRDDTRGEFAGARTLVKELLTLPTHSLLTPADIAAIKETVRHAEA
jgi:dTDP-4-amino-4,6-dideoxygalactose transaminase